MKNPKLWIVVKICDTTNNTISFKNIYSKYDNIETVPTKKFLETFTPHNLFD